MVVSLERAAGCDRVVPERIGTLQPATCSLDAALKFLDERGDPSRGDGRILVGLTDKRGWASATECEARGKQAVELRGCGLRLTAADRKRAVVSVREATGGVELSGLTVLGSLDAGLSITSARGAVVVHEFAARENGLGIRVGKTAAGFTLRNAIVEGSAPTRRCQECASNATAATAFWRAACATCR
jgi:hypothetical protein